MCCEAARSSEYSSIKLYSRMCSEAVKLRGVLKRVEDDLDAAYKELEQEPELAVKQDTKHFTGSIS